MADLVSKPRLLGSQRKRLASFPPDGDDRFLAKRIRCDEDVVKVLSEL